MRHGVGDRLVVGAKERLGADPAALDGIFQSGDGFVALHGSWNRSLHTGYKIARLPFKGGKPTGEYQDFVIGFTAGEENVWGRPVDVTFAKDGSMLFSDDGGGAIYRVTYKATVAAK